MRKLNNFFTGGEFHYGPRLRQQRRGGGLLCVEGKRRCLIGILSSKGRRRPYFVSSLRGGVGVGQGGKRAPDPSECTQFMAGMLSSFLSLLGTPMPPRITRDERRSSRLIGQKMEQARENYARPEIAHARSGGSNYLYRLLLIPSVFCCISFF